MKLILKESDKSKLYLMKLVYGGLVIFMAANLIAPYAKQAQIGLGSTFRYYFPQSYVPAYKAQPEASQIVILNADSNQKSGVIFLR